MTSFKILFFFLIALALQTVTAPSVTADVTVLIYHRFGESRYPTTNVELHRFAEQMAYLAANNYQVIPLAQVVSALKNGSPLPEKGVVITIDDGYRSVYHGAWPILKKTGYPFTVFLYTAATEKKHGDYMTWDQVRELKEAGVDFQDHGFGHHRFALKPEGLDGAAYEKWILDDLIASRKLFDQRLGFTPAFLALPYGEYNATVLRKARELGYQAVLTQDSGSVSDHTPVMTIPREAILGFEWAQMDHFKKILERGDLPLSDPVPGLDPIDPSQPPQFSARILFPERYRPGTIGIYVSELGWQRATVTDGVARIRNSSLLTKRINRVAVSGVEKDSGRSTIRYWMVTADTGK